MVSFPSPSFVSHYTVLNTNISSYSWNIFNFWPHIPSQSSKISTSVHHSRLPDVLKKHLNEEMAYFNFSFFLTKQIKMIFQVCKSLQFLPCRLSKLQQHFCLFTATWWNWKVLKWIFWDHFHSHTSSCTVGTLDLKSIYNFTYFTIYNSSLQLQNKFRLTLVLFFFLLELGFKLN